MMDEITIVNGPIVPDSTNIFQITLPNATVLTRTYDGPSLSDKLSEPAVVGENGELLYSHAV